MSKFETVYLFTDLGDSQIRTTIWIIAIFSTLLVCFFFFLISNVHTPEQPSFIKGKVYIRNASLPTINLLRALITIGLGWLVLMAIVIELATHPELGTQSPLRDPQYAEAQKTYNSHQYFVAEGVVHVLHTQNVNGHEKGDIIKIGDVEFVINYYGGLEFGYEQTISHGGALTEGTYARVFYIENGYWPDYTSLGRYTILRVDVKRK